MATFNINLGKLNELQSSLDSSNKKFSGINDQFFTKINKVNTLWNDSNTEVFLNQLKSDKNKIDQYNENAKNLILTTTLYELAKKYHYSIDKILGKDRDAE